MELAVLLTGIASAIALIGTLLLVARQAQILARQTALANKLAVHRASNDPLTGIRLVYSTFVAHPETYRYFYGGAQLPTAAGSELQDELAVRVRTIAELLADTLDLALATTDSVGIPERDRAGWEAAIDYWLSRVPDAQGDDRGPAGCVAVARRSLVQRGTSPSFGRQLVRPFEGSRGRARVGVSYPTIGRLRHG